MLGTHWTQRSRQNHVAQALQWGLKPRCRIRALVWSPPSAVVPPATAPAAANAYVTACQCGAAGAPEVGEEVIVDWVARLEKGLDAMVANTVNGLNTMPAKRLRFDCIDDDLRAIVEHMIETSQ